MKPKFIPVAGLLCLALLAFFLVKRGEAQESADRLASIAGANADLQRRLAETEARKVKLERSLAKPEPSTVATPDPVAATNAIQRIRPAEAKAVRTYTPFAVERKLTREQFDRLTAVLADEPDALQALTASVQDMAKRGEPAPDAKEVQRLQAEIRAGTVERLKTALGEENYAAMREFDAIRSMVVTIKNQLQPHLAGQDAALTPAQLDQLARAAATKQALTNPPFGITLPPDVLESAATYLSRAQMEVITKYNRLHQALRDLDAAAKKTKAVSP